jgi:hypothetical protein
VLTADRLGIKAANKRAAPAYWRSSPGMGWAGRRADGITRSRALRRDDRRRSLLPVEVWGIGGRVAELLRPPDFRGHCPRFDDDENQAG